MLCPSQELMITEELLFLLLHAPVLVLLMQLYWTALCLLLNSLCQTMLKCNVCLDLLCYMVSVCLCLLAFVPIQARITFLGPALPNDLYVYNFGMVITPFMMVLGPALQHLSWIFFPLVIDEYT